MSEVNVHNTGGASPVTECPKCEKRTLAQVAGKGSISGNAFTQFECLSCGYTKKVEADGCFVATVVYGDENEKELSILRRYRDNTLRRSRVGVVFVRMYYVFGPVLARKIQRHPSVKKRLRIVIDMVVRKIEKS